MKISEDLFLLIKSLDQSEKRYFKIFATMHNKKGEDNNYVKLFNAIEKQIVVGVKYDEELIRKQFKDAKFVNQFHVAKNYLYNSILKSLRMYNAEKTKEIELAGLIRDIRSLYEKLLLDQCKKLIDKGKKIAYKYERFNELLEILDWEKTVARSEAYTERSEKWLEEIYNEHIKVFENLQNINDYWHLTTKSFFIRKKQGDLKDKEEVALYNEIIDHPLLSSEDRAKTYISKNFYYNIKGLYYLTNKDYDNLHLYCNRLVGYIEENPDLLRNDNYIAALNNLLIVQIELLKFEEAFITIKKLRDIETASHQMKVRIFISSYDVELNIYLRTGQFEKGAALVDTIEEGLEKYKKNINQEWQLLFNYNIAYLYFAGKKYERSLDWLNRILNAKELNLREDLQCFARILNLFVHYEMHNYDLIEYVLRSTQRFLSSHKNLREFETMILSFLKKLINAKDEAGKIALFEEMIYRFNEVKDDIIVTKALEYFDFISWLESKIQKTGFEMILKEKYNKKAGAA